MSELVTLLGDDAIGVLRRDRSGRLTFVYDETWRRKRDAVPLSLSMPLAAAEHGHAAVDAFLWGLLPDNERVLHAWAKQFHVSARSAFALLTHVGEDCAGAVRFAQPHRAGEHAREGTGKVQWLGEKDIGDRLRTLQKDVTAWRSPGDTGQFSLAGAQPKTALLFDGKRWGVPSGRIPTTHILKPGIPGLGAHAENEHFCLALAGELGLPVVSSTIQHFDGEVAIVVERYDRVREGRRVVRVHQEDFCQALAVRPEHKYENDGGPGARSVTTLLRTSSRAPGEDVETFVQALAYNWLIAGTDGHAKNYSVLLGAASKVRLSPLYDIASALPYPGPELRKLKLAMKIGSKYRIREIGPHEWRKLADDLGLDPEQWSRRSGAWPSESRTFRGRCWPASASRGSRTRRSHAWLKGRASGLASARRACRVDGGETRVPPGAVQARGDSPQGTLSSAASRLVMFGDPMPVTRSYPGPAS